MLRDDGLLIITEITSDYELAMVMQGLLEGEKTFANENRKYGAYYTHKQMLSFFEECNLKLCNYQVQFQFFVLIFKFCKISFQKYFI